MATLYLTRPLVNSLGYYNYVLFNNRPSTFTLNGVAHNYFYHKYNTTWANERVVEVPIIQNVIKKYDEKNILEVGNVLSNYFPVTHDILDKYDKCGGVISQDVVDYHPSKKYDLIVSISTLEHVGFDEERREPKKVLLAIENLKNMLAPNGTIVVTLPIGYNNDMDKLLKENTIEFTKKYCLKRISANNKWIEADWKDVQNMKFNKPFNNANGLVIGVIQKYRTTHIYQTNSIQIQSVY